MQCPSCGATAQGRFCASCGAALKGAGCRACGEPLAPGARFCSRCGAPARGGDARPARGSMAAKAPWIVAALVFVAVAGVLVYRSAEPDTNAAAAGPMAVPGTAPVGPMGGSMRDNADRLFNRVMSEREAGNQEQSDFFLPMAIQAYQASGDLDADGLYHLGVLYNAGGQPDSARAVAARILESSPRHLLALAVAGEAAVMAGDRSAATDHYRTFLEAYDEERIKPLPEYLDHARVIPEYRETAQRWIDGDGAPG